ncbi:transglutaminase family protein [Asaia sp. W19]|uniref:transglutaminase family protein n=1 Tax=unclassified Asaia TaxID=2685023 RepID=UPI000F8E82A2|nr:transglutaminase family protein [Asaia sp. W19]RUT24608.1 transglutaminase family protein [Asaia sp. W19]RUT26546.1 transglutaminase family protein [Asaia sp. W19]
MSRPILLNHRTTYRYDRMVSLGPQTIRLRPPLRMRNAITTYALSIGPSHAGLTWGQDSHDNLVSQVIFSERMSEFVVDVSMIVDLAPYDPLPALSPGGGAAEPLDPTYRRPVVEANVLTAFLQADDPSPVGTHLARLTTLARRIATRLHYMRRMEPGVWAPGETLAREAGSCRDSAWLLIALARHLGYAARFVSGYLVEPSALQVDPDRLTCDLHAWAEIWVPDQGWVGFDTTSGLITAQNHIPLAASDTPDAAAPVSGLLDRCDAEFDVLMQAHYLHREPKP